MAASKRQKKIQKGKERVKVVQGGKTRNKANVLSRALEQGKAVARGGVLGALTGSSNKEREQLIRAGKTPRGPTKAKGATSAPLHSLTSKQISDTFGPDIAAVLGLVQESVSGLSGKLSGNAFLNPGGGEHGFSSEDIRSNFAGQEASRRESGSKNTINPIPISQLLGFANELAFENESSGQKLLSGKNVMEAIRSLIPKPSGTRQGERRSIPRGKHGGRMSAEAVASGRGVARQRFAVGGSTAASTLGETTSESEAKTTSKEGGTGFTQSIADTGTLDNIIQQLRGIKGFSNLGRSTLDAVLRTGLPTDVSGITEAAKIRAGQEFDDATNVIGERLANLGLVSSSAQTTAVARERGKLGERIAAAGMEARVAAAESAANRRFGATGVDTQGQSTRFGALGKAGSLAANSASLNARTNTGFGRSGLGSSSTSSKSTSLSNPGVGNLATVRPRRSISSRGGASGTSNRGGARQPGGTGLRGGFGFAKGGRVPELDDVLSGVLEGTFNPTTDTLTKADRLKAERGRIARFEEDNVGLVNSRKEIGEFLQVNHPGILRMLLGGPGGAGALQAADPGTNVTPGMQANIDRSAKRAHAGARTPVPRQNFALGGPVEGDPEPISTPNKGAVPQPGLPQENGQMVPGLLDPRRQFFEEGGGVAPGVDSGADKVPAMLRAEELVVTPELTDELLNVDPNLPQPGLITALQQLAQQPLEFGEKESELVAGHGGSVQPGTIPGQFGIPIPGAQGQTGVSPEGLPSGLQQLIDFLSRQGSAQVDPATGGIVIEGVGPASRPTPEFEGKFLPGAGASGPTFDSLIEGEDFGSPDFSVPGPPLRAPSLTESVGKAGERSFTLDGGSPGTGVLGTVGVAAGLNPSKGPLKGGDQFAPGVSRQAPGTAGSVSGSAVIIDPETGLPMDFSGEQMSRLERAQRIADLTRSAIRTDPVGGPEKQSRMLRALEIANREVDSSVNEIIQGQKLAIERQQVQNAGVVAQGQLNASIAQTLQAQAQKVTAEGALAKQVAELAANNPVVTAAMNKLELLAKNPEMDPNDRDRILAILTRELQVAGIELTESGFFADLFGAPGFTISPVAQEQGVPDPDGGNDGQQELQTLMSRAKAGMSTEDFQHIMEIM